MMTTFHIHRVGANELPLMHGLLDTFSEAFDDPESYTANRPPAEYLTRLLHSDTFVALVALHGEAVVGALAAYELQKFEQARSEFYIYDLAVNEPFRRRGIASALIVALQQIAAERGASVIFVQADYGDDPAIALYTALGTREDVMHFDIPVPPAALASSSTP